MPDIFPETESRLAPWLDNFAAQITKSAATLGLSTSESQAAVADSGTLSHLIRQTEQQEDQADNHPDAYRHLYIYKELMKNGASQTLRTNYPDAVIPMVTNDAPGILPRLGALVEKIRIAPGYTNEIGHDLDIAFDSGIPVLDNIPKGDNELIGWMQRFIDHLRPQATVLGIGAAEIEATQQDHDVLKHLVRIVDEQINSGKAANRDFRELVDYKDFYKYGLMEKVAAVFPMASVPIATAVAPGILSRIRPLAERLPADALLGTAVLGTGAVVGSAVVGAASARKLTTPVDDDRKKRAAIVPPVAPLSTVTPVTALNNGNQWVFPLIALLGLGGVGWLLWPKGDAPMATDAPTITRKPVKAVAPTAAPERTLESAIAVRKPEDVLVLADKAAAKWMGDASDGFNKTQTGGKILLAGLGSREGRDNILYDKKKIQPEIWAPGDIYWIDKLKGDAAGSTATGKSGATVGDGKALVKTYVVLLMRDDRAKLFEEASAKPEYAGKTWKLLGHIAAKGWSVAGGDASSGKLKLLHANPTQSNSGMTALSLEFAEYKRAHPNATVNDAAFLKSVAALEGTVGDNFPASTAETLDTFKDTSKGYDAAVVYESEAIRALDGGMKGVRIVYPSPTSVVIVPAAPVEAKWVTAAQKEIGGKFVDYLLSAEQQEKAVSLGYRPATEAFADQVKAYFGDAGRKQAGMLVAPKYAGSEVDSKAKEGLIFNWANWYKTKFGKDATASK